MKVTSERVLRALGRFDVATVEDVASSSTREKRNAWAHLQRLVAAGLVQREGKRGEVARYRLTVAGRAAISRATA